MEQPGTKTCPSCQTVNSAEAVFCCKCGNKFSTPSKKCKLCGKANPVASEFCDICGSEFSEAALGVTRDRALEWEHWLSLKNSFYQSISGEGGLIQKFRAKSRSITDKIYPDRKIMEGFFIPISSSPDWCIQSLEIDGIRVKNGLLLALETELRTVDFQREQVWRIPYENISRYRFLDGWLLEIAYANNKIIRLQVKRPSIAGNLFHMATNTYMGARGSMVDRYAAGRANQDETQRVEDKFKTGEHFWGSFLKFLDEVFSHQD